MKIVLALTGSVASILHRKLYEKLSEVGTVQVIATNSARAFITTDKTLQADSLGYTEILRDADEWTWTDPGYEIPRLRYKPGDAIQHIKIGDDASALVVAPCSANTLAKIANGLSDNLVTSVARSWDFQRPMIIAPAMNTRMWEHPITAKHLAAVRSFGVQVVSPQSKELACGTTGMGAMAEISKIVARLRQSLQWRFPLLKEKCSGIPVKGHPGSFLHQRKMHVHTGVDLYTHHGAAVYAVEDGTLVGIEQFTGTAQQTPWWEDTHCTLVEGASGVVCYGEIKPFSHPVGTRVSKGMLLGHVKRVLKPGKERPDIPGHSPSMLHIELYPHGRRKAFEELPPNPDSFSILQDPTQKLIDALDAPKTLLKIENECRTESASEGEGPVCCGS